MKFKLLSLYFILHGLLSVTPVHAQEAVNLDVNAFEKAIAQPGIQLLDVRTLHEYQTGHLKSSMLADWTSKEAFKTGVAALDKSRPVYTYCLSGGRSTAAANYLRQNGFVTYNLEGGISSWKRQGKPVEEVTKVKQMNLQSYQSLIPESEVVLADFTASWCPPCIKMKPVIDSLVKANSGRFRLLAIDGAAQTELAKELKVEAFPTFIVYKKGKEAWRKSGIVSATELLKHL